LSIVVVNKTPFKVFEVRSRLGWTLKYFELTVIAFDSQIAIYARLKLLGIISFPYKKNLAYTFFGKN